MSTVAVLIADMVRAGVDPELIGRTAAALAEREPVKIIDEQAGRKRAADRERMRLKRESSNSRATSRDIAEPSLDKKEIPQTPLEKTNPIPPSPPKGGSSPAEDSEFSEFWALYPHKVGKPDARKKFAKARRSASFGAIMAGLRAYVAKTDDRPWCNPATWLNQERWGDEPARAQSRDSPRPSSKPLRGSDWFFASAAQDLIDEKQRNGKGQGGYRDDVSRVPLLTIEHWPPDG